MRFFMFIVLTIEISLDSTQIETDNLWGRAFDKALDSILIHDSLFANTSRKVEEHHAIVVDTANTL